VPETAINYEQQDYAAVSEALGGWVPSPLPSSNWRGAIHEIESLQPQPEPSSDLANPTCFLVWDLTYSKFEPCMDTMAAPVRWGEITTVVYSQPGADIGPVLAIVSGVRAMFAAASMGNMIVSPDLAMPQRVGRRGSWYLRGLRIPFAAG